MAMQPTRKESSKEALTMNRSLSGLEARSDTAFLALANQSCGVTGNKPS